MPKRRKPCSFRSSTVAPAGRWRSCNASTHEWDHATEGRRTIRRSFLLQDRTDPSHFVVVAFFDDAEAARVNSELPETDTFAKTMMAQAIGETTFTDFDLKEEKNY